MDIDPALLQDGDATTATTATAASSQPPATIADNNNENDDENDPVVATYSVFIKPPLPENRKLVVLKYISKTGPDPNHLQQPRVLGLRVKPRTGMIEVDTPIDTLSEAYDRNKGVKWGTALQKSMEAKKGGSLGLAGGFGIGAALPPRQGGGGGGRSRAGGGGGGGGNDDDAAPLTWAEATRQGKVLREQTLGGVLSPEEDVKYMVGVFQGKNIHLTPVSATVLLRPTHHHIDATVEQERLSRPQPAGGGPGGGGPGGAADKSAGRAIHMTLKAAMDEDGVRTETMVDRLRALQREPWKRMEYAHDESEASWATYNECLLLRSNNKKKYKASDEGTGKGKEPASAGDASGNEGDDDSGDPELRTRVPQLKTDWVEEDLLRGISRIGPNDKKPGEEAVTEGQTSFSAKLAALKSKEKEKGKAKAPATAMATATAGDAQDQAQTPAPAKKRGLGRPAKAAATATTRGKAGGNAGNAMELD